MQLHLIITNLKNTRENGFERTSRIEINRIEIDEQVPLYEDFGDFIWTYLKDLQNKKYDEQCVVSDVFIPNGNYITALKKTSEYGYSLITIGEGFTYELSFEIKILTIGTRLIFNDIQVAVTEDHSTRHYPSPGGEGFIWEFYQRLDRNFWNWLRAFIGIEFEGTDREYDASTIIAPRKFEIYSYQSELKHDGDNYTFLLRLPDNSFKVEATAKIQEAKEFLNP
ncbi:hypothetical protein [Levilactobacillus brevis]|uniref:hypothetical protein n=1 Tax=Levilactobacillus brevis TaxID=1580 RepID=UPI00339CA597